MRWVSLFILAGCVVVASSCAWMTRDDKMLQAESRINRQIIEFYDTGADAYFLIGFEYFTLASEMEKTGKTDLSQEYAAKARLYRDLSMEWKRLAKKAREEGVALPPMSVSGGR